MSDINMYSIGVCAASVCVPKETPKEIVEQWANEYQPTGISSDWKISEDKTFKTGELNPCVCEHDSSRVHYLLTC